MLSLVDSQSFTNLGRGSERRFPADHASKTSRPKRKLYGRVSEVTVLGRLLSLAGPAGIAFGLPLLLIGVGAMTSFFGILICYLERRAVTRY